jgi:hypothetical protein
MVQTPVGRYRLRQQRLDLLAQSLVASAHPVQKRPALARRPCIRRVIELLDPMQAIRIQGVTS